MPHTRNGDQGDARDFWTHMLTLLNYAIYGNLKNPTQDYSLGKKEKSGGIKNMGNQIVYTYTVPMVNLFNPAETLRHDGYSQANKWIAFSLPRIVDDHASIDNGLQVNDTLFNFGSSKYYLCGIIHYESFKGDRASGHYYADIKHNGQWLRVNDMMKPFYHNSFEDIKTETMYMIIYTTQEIQTEKETNIGV